MADTLSLYWGEKIVGVEASVGHGTVGIRRQVFAEFAEDVGPAEAGAALKAALQEQGVSARQAVVVLPRHDVVTRVLELPQVPDEELPDLVKWQAETRSSVPLDQMSVDYLPLPLEEGAETRSVLLATIPNKTLNDIRETLAAAGIELKGASIASIALTDLVISHFGVPAGGVGLVVAGGQSQLDVTIHHDGRTVFTHSAPLAAESDRLQAARQAVSRSLFAAGNSLPGLVITSAHLLGPDAEALRETVGERLGGTDGDPDVVVVTLEELIGQEIAPELAAHAAEVAATIGQLNGLAGLIEERIDFLDPHRPPAAARRVSLQTVVRVAVGVLLAFGLVYGLQTVRTHDIDKQIEAVKADIVTEEIKFLGRAAKPTDLLPPIAGVAKWQEKQVSWLDQLHELTPLFGDNDEVVLTQIDMTQELRKGLGRVTVSGLAIDREPVAELTNRVRGHKNYQLTPRNLDTIKNRGDEFRYRFSKVDVSLEGIALPPKPPASVSSPKATGGTGS